MHLFHLYLSHTRALDGHGCMQFMKEYASDQRWKFLKENKKVRKRELDQESDQEKKKVFSFFLGRFLDRVLVFLFSFINSHLCHGYSVRNLVQWLKSRTVTDVP